MSLAEELTSMELVPYCERGQVTLVKYDVNSRNYTNVPQEVIDRLGVVEGYIDEHPEGSDRGGYVPTVFAGDDAAYYDENEGEWVDTV